MARWLPTHMGIRFAYESFGAMQVANRKPTALEIRTLLLMLSFPCLIGMAQWAEASPHGQLWNNQPFRVGCAALWLMGMIGLFELVRHWGSQSLVPVLIVVTGGLVAFGSPSIAVFVALAVAFLAACYLQSPDRIDAALRIQEDSLRAEIRQRDEDLKTKEEALQTVIGERNVLRTQARSDSVQLVSRNVMEQAEHEAAIAGIEFRAGKREDELLATITRLEHETETLKEQLDDRFPKFVADIFEIQASEPEGVPDLRAALLVSLGNSGAKSSALTYQVQARTVHGVNIAVQIVPTPEFVVLLDDGRAICYKPEHYIMSRTRNTPVERGAPVDGVVPCIFPGIKSIREIDLRSLRVRFTDGTGDADGKPRWWSTGKLTSLADVDTKPQRVRIGLPSAEPI